MHPDALKAWRKMHGFTQTEVGEILGVKKLLYIVGKRI